MSGADTAKFICQIEKTSASILGILLIALVSIECAQVFLRYAFALGFLWVTDIRMLLLLSLGWIGAAHLWITRSHIAVSFFGSRLSLPPGLLQTGCDVIVLTGVIYLLPVFLDAMALYSTMVMPTLPLSLGIKYIPPVTGLCLIGFGAMLNLLRVLHIRTAANKQP